MTGPENYIRHNGIFKNVFNILIVQISGLGRTLHLIKDMNEFGFQAKGESSHFAKERNTDSVRKGCHINSKKKYIDKFIIIL